MKTFENCLTQVCFNGCIFFFFFVAVTFCIFVSVCFAIHTFFIVFQGELLLTRLRAEGQRVSAVQIVKPPEAIL